MTMLRKKQKYDTSALLTCSKFQVCVGGGERDDCDLDVALTEVMHLDWGGGDSG